eukprot:SM000148S01002  [mRNA]  locus=s148:51811:54982:+ [translate_table: standard]
MASENPPTSPPPSAKSGAGNGGEAEQQPLPVALQTDADSADDVPPGSADEREARRLRKWRRMVGSGSVDWKLYKRRRPLTVKNRIRKGIPDCLRGQVWQLVSGSWDLLLANQGIYQSYFLKSYLDFAVNHISVQLVFYESSAAEIEIIRDISRTFPTHVFYSQRHGRGQRSLYNVLKAYSIYDRNVGYVQGMGFLAGLLLLYMSEEATFWLLIALLKGAKHTPMEGLYMGQILDHGLKGVIGSILCADFGVVKPTVPSYTVGLWSVRQHGLPLVQQYLHEFDKLMHEHLPRLGAHFDEEMVRPSMYASQWFITIFSYSFPFPTLLRIWDVFLHEGMSIVFRVGLALLKHCEDDLIRLPFEELIYSLKTFPEDALDPNRLLPLAFSINIKERLKQVRAEYLQEQLSM